MKERTFPSMIIPHFSYILSSDNNPLNISFLIKNNSASSLIHSAVNVFKFVLLLYISPRPKISFILYTQKIISFFSFAFSENIGFFIMLFLSLL